jgi:ABC-type Fe3+ transport system permease subunit
MLKKSNFKEWFNRYKYAELASTSAALTTSLFSKIYSGLTTAYLITFAEYMAFYSVILFSSYKKLHKQNSLLSQKTSSHEIFRLLKNLILEFGYPAFLDFLIIRPFCMYWMPILFGNYFFGIIFGKISADLCFYCFTIINYELIKRK